MKKVVLSTIMLVSFGMISFAQQNEQPKEVERVELQRVQEPVKAKTNSNLEKVKEALDLDEEQTKRVAELLELRSETQHKNREAGIDREQAKEVNEKFLAEFKSILTPEQLEKFETLQKESETNKASSLKEKEGLKVIEPNSKTKK